MELNKDAYIKLVNRMKSSIDEMLELIFKNDDNKQQCYIHRLCSIARDLGIGWDDYENILNFVEPKDVEYEIKRVKANKGLKFIITSMQSDRTSKACWELEKTNGQTMYVDLTKQGVIYCDCGAYSITESCPQDIDWFISQWAKGTLE